MNIESIPGVAVIGAVEGPGSGVAVGNGNSGHDRVVVDPLGSAAVELIDGGKSSTALTVIVGAESLIEDLAQCKSRRTFGLTAGNTTIEDVLTQAGFLSRGADEDDAVEGILASRGSGGEVDLKADGEGAGGGEEELVGGDSDAVGSVGLGGGGGGGNGTSRDVVSVDLSALEVGDEAVLVVDGGVDGGDVGTVGEIASETVVTSGGGEVGEGVASGSGPASITEGGLGPGVGGLGDISVLPIGDRAGDEVGYKGV